MFFWNEYNIKRIGDLTRVYCERIFSLRNSRTKNEKIEIMYSKISTESTFSFKGKTKKKRKKGNRT